MPPASTYLQRHSRARPRWIAIATLLGGSLAAGWLRAEPPPSNAPGSGSLGQYLSDHEADLDPFFIRNSAALTNDFFRHLVSLFGETLAFILIAGWVIDLLLSRGYSTLIAPAYANFNRALIYAGGRLALNVILTVVLALDLTSCLTLMGPGTTTTLVFLLLTLSAFVVQVVWFSKVYRCSLANAVAFYLILLVVHTIVLGLAVPILFSASIDRGVKAYVDESVAPRLRQEADAARAEAAGRTGPRDAAKRQVADLEARISAARTEEATLQKAIEDQKNSAAYAFSALVRLRAQGDLTGARSKFEDFLQHYPNDPLDGPARGQVAEIDRALAAQAELRKEQAADAARAAAQARADLLARAATGQVTLSEMRLALIGKTPTEVHALFGVPAETGPDRWGYAQKMILNPADNTRHGLAVIFSDGLVQGVDYYYGSAP